MTANEIPTTTMDLRLSPEQQRFSDEIRAFLEHDVDPAELLSEEAHANEHSHTIYAQLAERGWLGMHLPEAYGGQGRGAVDLAIFRDWSSYYRVPLGGYTAASRIGHALHLLGSDEQRERFLPGLVRGEQLYCIGYSEPEAGSDLANLKTRATASGTGFRVNGQKIFTTAGHLADYVFLACRTDPEAARHRGISVFMVDLRSEGVRIDPIWTLGGWRLNTIFFDEVAVPEENVVGGLNNGWRVIRAALDVERTGIQPVSMARRLVDDLWQLVWENPESLARPRAEVVTALTELDAEVASARLLAYRLAWRQEHGVISSSESAISKLAGSEAYQRAADLAVDVAGGDLFVTEPGRNAVCHLEREYRYAPQATIAAGTSEIMRNLIATDRLGLPAR